MGHARAKKEMKVKWTSHWTELFSELNLKFYHEYVEKRPGDRIVNGQF